MYSFQGLPNDVSWKIMGIPGDGGSPTSTPRNGYSRGRGGLKQRTPPWGEWIFSGPATHHGAAYIKLSHKLSPIGRRR